MPRPRPRARDRQAGELDDITKRYFLDEISASEALDEYKPKDNLYVYNEDRWKFQFMFWENPGQGKTEEEVWQQHGEDLVAEYVHNYPGYRQSAWWRYTAPRASDELVASWGLPKYWLLVPDRPCEPRIRLGGIGTPCFECLAHVPAFHCGIPYPWIDQKMVDLYTGNSLDIHGNPLKRHCPDKLFVGIPIDPDNPPQFESEASYLKRHNLFLPGESRRLKPEDFEPETLNTGEQS